MIPRIATSADVAAIVRVINRAYRVEDFFIKGDRTNAADIRARQGTPNACFIVMDAPAPVWPARGLLGELSGAVFVKTLGDRGYFGMLSVDPDHQHRGLGRKLVDAAEARCRDAGCHALDIDVVNLRTELPPIYASLGFTPSGIEPFPEPEKLRRPAHMVRMSKPLAPR
jgi:GNAT superfamily N-acetyltransferase